MTVLSWHVDTLISPLGTRASLPPHPSEAQSPINAPISLMMLCVPHANELLGHSQGTAKAQPGYLGAKTPWLLNKLTIVVAKAICIVEIFNRSIHSQLSNCATRLTPKQRVASDSALHHFKQVRSHFPHLPCIKARLSRPGC